MGYNLAALSVIITIVLCCAIASDSAECDCGEKYYPIFKIGQHSCTCKTDTAGQLKFSEGHVFVCNGSEWKALQYVAYGSKLNPGHGCGDIKAKNAKQSANGIYWITLPDSSDEFPVYCDMEAGGWTMVFKAVSGVSESVYGIYNSADPYCEKVLAALDVTNKSLEHYKNRIVLNWEDFGPSEARVVLYKGGTALKELIFNAKGSDKLNWFSFDSLTNYPWSDLKTKPRNHFSIIGGHNRNFHINSIYGGCPGDSGWMTITGYHCQWEKHFRPSSNVQVILYSKVSGCTNWNSYDHVGVADVLAVYLR